MRCWNSFNISGPIISGALRSRTRHRRFRWSSLGDKSFAALLLSLSQTYTHTHIHIHTNSICIKISLAPKIVPHHSQEAGGAPEVIRHFRVWILRKSMGPWQWDIHPVENVVLLNFIGGQIRGNPLPPGNSTVCYGTSPFFMGK